MQQLDREFQTAQRTAMIRRVFSQYDFDGSGDLNSSVEIQQLTMNLYYKLSCGGDARKIGRGMSNAELEVVLQTIGHVGDENAWSFEDYKAWFDSHFSGL